MSSSPIKSSTETIKASQASDKTTEAQHKMTQSSILQGSVNRKKLHVLQEKADKNVSKSKTTGPSSLVGREIGGFAKIFATAAKPAAKGTGKGIKVYEDSEEVIGSSSSPNIATPKCLKSNYTQTKITGSDIADLEATYHPDVQFYKELAEKRREALNESLNENEMLWIDIEERKEKIKTLEDKVLSLEETVEKARKISEILGPYLIEEVENVDNEPDKEIEQCPENTSNDASENVKSAEEAAECEAPEKILDVDGSKIQDDKLLKEEDCEGEQAK